mmetsp:Transcript_37015/g.104493  ORF Transcript_37015/g.104493 Transcript_37015/m.104493 type:complete len:291 (+) Transcript_37015:41-913(+)
MNVSFNRMALHCVSSAASGRDLLGAASGAVLRRPRSTPRSRSTAPRIHRCSAQAAALNLRRATDTSAFARREVFQAAISSGLATGRFRCRSRSLAVSAMASEPKKVLVPVADGCEEMEAVITIDVLVRAGAAVTVASVDGQVVNCSRGVKLQADTLIADASSTTYDLIAVPGGMPGAEHFRDCKPLVQMIQDQKAAGRLYAAICASPAVVFEHHGLLDGQPATSHPAFQDRLTNKGSAGERVVESGTLTTSQGPGTAFEFALSLVKQLYGEEKMREIAGPMCMYPTPLLS